MLMLQRFPIILLFDIVTSVNAGGCFVPDTTWNADNKGIVNVTNKVILYFQPVANGTN